jgi:hypothetical protein
MKYLIFSTKIYLFYTHHPTQPFIVKQLCEDILFQIF